MRQTSSDVRDRGSAVKWARCQSRRVSEMPESRGGGGASSGRLCVRVRAAAPFASVSENAAAAANFSARTLHR
eukprot:3109433-Pleurochrysis_carterae.AAC.1